MHNPGKVGGLAAKLGTILSFGRENLDRFKNAWRKEGLLRK
jgi:hypothetical protein